VSGGLNVGNGDTIFYASVGVVMGHHTISDLSFMRGNPAPRGGPDENKDFQAGPLNTAFHQVMTLVPGSDRGLANDLNGGGASIVAHGQGGGTVDLGRGGLSNDRGGRIDVSLLDDDPFMGGGNNILRVTTGRDAFGGGALDAIDLDGNIAGLSKDHDPGGGSRGGGFGSGDLAMGARNPFKADPDDRSGKCGKEDLSGSVSDLGNGGDMGVLDGIKPDADVRSLSVLDYIITGASEGLVGLGWTDTGGSLWGTGSGDLGVHANDTAILAGGLGGGDPRGGTGGLGGGGLVLICGGGDVCMSSDDVLGGISVGGGVHLGTGGMCSCRGGGGLDTCGSGVQSIVSSLMRDDRNTRNSSTTLGDCGDALGDALSTDWQRSGHVSHRHPRRG
jgi:hypothetical protein